jgi:hypothetical protein
MKLVWDEQKRADCLRERGLDFADAAQVLAGPTHRFVDQRSDYGEVRMVAVGYLHGRMMIVVFTDRINERRIISMRKANERDQKKYESRMG